MDEPSAPAAPAAPRMDVHVTLSPLTASPYRQLILTDLEYHGRVTAQEAEEDPNKLRLFRELHAHVRLLCDGGAAGPFSRISGFDSNGVEYTPFHKLRDNIPIGLVYWGSPHWGTTAQETFTQGWKDSNQFKTNAFESMSWLAGQAIVAMTYTSNYKVEFWSPNYRQDDAGPETRVARRLIVDEAYTRQYVPLASGDSWSPIFPAGTTINIALLVPHRLLHLVTYVENKIDVGMTFYRALRACQDADYFAIELGGQTYSLSNEIHLARQELDGL